MHFLRSNVPVVDSTVFLIFFSSRYWCFVELFVYDTNIRMRLVAYPVYCVCEMDDNDMRMHIRDADDKPENNKNVFAVASECRALSNDIQAFDATRKGKRCTTYPHKIAQVTHTKNDGHEIGKCVAV